MPIKTFIVKGKKYQVTRSNRKNKKFKVKVSKDIVHFGAKGYSISPGTKKGNRYCARSSGIKGKGNIKSANFWSRKMWKCRGKKSVKK